MTDQIHILNVDDHLLVCAGTTVINGQSDVQVAAQVCGGCEAIQRVGEHKPDVTLVDRQLPGWTAACEVLAWNAWDQ